MIRKERLFTPGPTALHPSVQSALSRPIIHHRTEEFRAVFRACRDGLKAFFKEGGQPDDITLMVLHRE